MGIKWKEDYSAKTQRWFGVLVGLAVGFLCLAVFQTLSGEEVQWAAWFQGAATVVAIIVAMQSSQADREHTNQQRRAEAELEVLLQEIDLTEFYRHSFMAFSALKSIYDVQLGVSSEPEHHEIFFRRAVHSVERMREIHKKINWKLFVVRDDESLVYVRKVMVRLAILEKACIGRDYKIGFFVDSITRDAAWELHTSFVRLIEWTSLGE